MVYSRLILPKISSEKEPSLMSFEPMEIGYRRSAAIKVIELIG
jgi:hypothetical protein